MGNWGYNPTYGVITPVVTSRGPPGMYLGKGTTPCMSVSPAKSWRPKKRKPIYFSYAACGAADEYTKGNDEACVNQEVRQGRFHSNNNNSNNNNNNNNKHKPILLIKSRQRKQMRNFPSMELVDLHRFTYF